MTEEKSLQEYISEKLENASPKQQEIIITEVLKAMNEDLAQDVTIHIGRDNEYYDYGKVPMYIIDHVLGILRHYEDAPSLAAEPATAYQVSVIKELIDEGRLKDYQAADLIRILKEE